MLLEWLFFGDLVVHAETNTEGVQSFAEWRGGVVTPQRGKTPCAYVSVGLRGLDS